jgi:hypothetical protein
MAKTDIQIQAQIHKLQQEADGLTPADLPGRTAEDLLVHKPAA